MSFQEHEEKDPSAAAAADPSGESVTKAADKAPMRLGIDWKVLPFIAFGLLMMIAPAVCQEMREGPILRDGTPAKARVLAIKPTGSSYNDDQEVEIDLEVQPV